MPGMNSGIKVNDPQVVSAFMTALLHQGLVALLIFATIGLLWVTVRAWPQAGASDPPGTDGARPAGREAVGRQVLRVGFGILWVFDGILQAQPKMAIGLPASVIEPTAATS